MCSREHRLVPVDDETLLHQRRAEIVQQPVDEHGLVVDERLHRVDAVYVTPSHQIPTAVSMPLERRQELMRAATEADFLLIEDAVMINFVDSYFTGSMNNMFIIKNNTRMIYVAIRIFEKSKIAQL